MAYASKVTIGTGNKISQSYQSQDVFVSVTYELERPDTDLLAFMAAQAVEVEACHAEAWRGIMAARTERAQAAGELLAHQKEQDEERAEPAPSRRTRRAKDNGSPAEPAAEPSPISQATTEAALEPGASPTSVPAENGSTQATPETAPAIDTHLFEPATGVQKMAISHLAKRQGQNAQDLAQTVARRYGKAGLDDLTKTEAAELLLALQKGDPDRARMTA